MTQPDRSNHPSFYDPEYGLPECSDSAYWVEVLCDGGEEYGAAVWAYDEQEAGDKAMDEAVEHGKRPVEVISCTLN